MLLPAILLRIKPVVTQERAELESDYDLIAPKVGGPLYAVLQTKCSRQAATVYAANFTVDENAPNGGFSFVQPAGQKLIEKWPAIAQQNCADRSGRQPQGLPRKFAAFRLTDALRQKGHKLN